MRRASLLIAVVFLAGASEASGASGEVRDGPARFQVLTPSLIRLEYAENGVFEDRPTLIAATRPAATAKFRTRVVDGVRIIRTSDMLLRYVIGSGPFSPSNLSLRLEIGGRKRLVNPGFPAPLPTPSTASPPRVPLENPDPDPSPVTAGNLGGWYRGLDGQRGPVPLHDGLLSRDGWYLLDDTASPVLTEGGSWYEERAAQSNGYQEGPYQDGYLFAYGDDYVGALGDFRRLTGPAPLLPQKAFGNWFSRYQGYSERDYRELLAEFRTNRVPLDVLVVDTDFKSPHDWNGWQWTPAYFPEPRRFLDWAHSEGVDVTLNVHPSISPDDPAYAGAEATAGGLIDGGPRCGVFIRDPEETCAVWDWAQRDDVASYFGLHQPFEADGVDSWWLDWCCDESRVSATTLPGDTWINSLYAQRQRARGIRWLPLARIGSSMWDYPAPTAGAWAEHRSTIHFTGDSASTWEMLDFQTRFSAAEGAGIGHPYVSHDIGGFLGNELPDDLYARWVQLGAMQPILRLHSDHAPRLPWEYGGRAGRVAGEFMRLRASLVPYLYTLAREAYDNGLPLVRAMYLGWPQQRNAYRFDRQYMLGDELLVAPVAKPGDPARKKVWFPPGRWTDIFTGSVYSGSRSRLLSVPLDRMPVFARAGGVVVRQPYGDFERPGANGSLLVDVYAGDDGGFELYEDEGKGFGYEAGEFARTRIRWREKGAGGTLEIGPARGGYPGDIAKRSYEVTITGVERPGSVTIGNRATRPVSGWDYDASRRMLRLELGALSTRRPATIQLQPTTDRKRRR